MKRILAVLAPLALAACGGTGALHLDFNSDDTQTGLLNADTSAEKLWNPHAGPSANLADVQSIIVTVKEVDVHLADTKAPDDVKGEDVKDDDGGWHVVNTTEQQFDLMSIRASATKPLGDITLPEGKITQIRLKLKPGTLENGQDRLVDAITDTDGSKCDLLITHSAVDPGVKITGVFKAGKVDANGKHTAVVNIKLTDSSKDTTGTKCTFKLNPVIKIKKYDTDAKK